MWVFLIEEMKPAKYIDWNYIQIRIHLAALWRGIFVDRKPLFIPTCIPSGSSCTNGGEPNKGVD